MRSGMLTLKPIVWSAYGLLNEGFFVYQTPNVGSVEPFATAS